MIKNFYLFTLGLICLMLFSSCESNIGTNLEASKNITEEKKIENKIDTKSKISNKTVTPKNVIDKNKIVVDEKIKYEKTPSKPTTKTYTKTSPTKTKDKKSYLPFTQELFDEELKTDKTIILMFYSTWCSACTTESDLLEKKFSSFDNNKIIILRVNYNDGDTDSYETALAEKYDISSRHDRVIIKNNDVIRKYTGNKDYAFWKNLIKEFY